MINFIKFFLTFFLFINSLFSECLVEEQIKLIPRQDQIILEKFFREIICKYDIGYTLWGKKPATIITWTDLSLNNLFFCLGMKTSFLEEGWQTWKKYEKLFPIKSYSFIYQTFDNDDEPVIHEIALIHRAHMNHIVKQHPDLFDSSLPATVFSHDIESENYHLKLGLLLGYGYENSKIFQERYDSFTNESYEKKNHKRSWGTLRNFKDFHYLNLIPLPSFRVDYQLTETEKLYDEYIESQRIITEKVNDPHFLQLVLKTMIN